MKLRLVFLSLAVALAARAADAPPQFNATLTVGKEHRFVLVDANGKASAFLALGQSFDGYTLKAYDAPAGALDLERDGKVSRVTLVADATVASGPAAALPGTVADAEAVLNRMHFDEMMERVLDRQKKAVAAQFQNLATRITAQGGEPGEAAALQKKMTDEIFGVLDAKQLKGDVSKIYSEVFTKQELDQISAFYGTPLGEMLAAKQPEVQDRLAGVIQTKMAEVMPRVQKMTQDFAQQQKAKRAAAGNPATSPVAPAPAP